MTTSSVQSAHGNTLPAKSPAATDSAPVAAFQSELESFAPHGKTQPARNPNPLLSKRTPDIGRDRDEVNPSSAVPVRSLGQNQVIPPLTLAMPVPDQNSTEPIRAPLTPPPTQGDANAAEAKPAPLAVADRLSMSALNAIGIVADQTRRKPFVERSGSMREPASPEKLAAPARNATVLTLDAGLLLNDGSRTPLAPLQSELGNLCSDGKSQPDQSANPPQPTRVRGVNEINLMATAPILLSERKDQVIPPQSLANPAARADASATKQADLAEPQPKDSAPDVLTRQANVPDSKAAEITPAVLAFAARLSLPTFSNTAAAQVRLKPLPTQAQAQGPISPKVSSTTDQTKLKPPVEQSGSVRQPSPPPKPAAPVSPAMSTAQPEARRTKEPELPPAAAPAKTDLVLSRIEPNSSETTAAPKALVAPAEPSLTERMDRVIEPAAAPPTSPSDIRVRVPDNKGGSTEVRFVENAGEVRVSVRTANPDLAQTLRGGLDDLTHRLSNEGVRAEMWHPGVVASTRQSDLSQQSSPQDQSGAGSQNDNGSKNNGSGSHSSGNNGSEGREQRGSQERRPRWLDELEASISDRKT